MCPANRFTLHLMKHTHKHFILGLKVITGFDKYWFTQVIRDPPTYCTSKVFDFTVICLRSGCPSWDTQKESWKELRKKTSVSLELKIHFAVIPMQFPPLFSRKSSKFSSPHYRFDVHFCWGLAWANKINPKNQHILNNSACIHTLPPPSTSTTALTQTITTSRNSTECPSKGNCLFHIYT